MSSLSLDWESRSLISLPDTGVYVYAMHSSTDLILGAWMFDDMADPELWTAGEPCPERVADHIASGGEIRAFNASFERLLMQYIASPRYGWPAAKMEQFVCSAAEAAAMSLPRSLGKLAEVLGVEAQKDDGGHNLMMRMCRPRSVLDDGTPVWWTDDVRMARLGAYCVQDVRAERACSKALRRLTDREREVYLLTERMNDRGIQTDVALIDAAEVISRRGIDDANEQLKVITGGAVASVTKINDMKRWLETQHVATTQGIGKAALRALLDSDIPEAARQMLEIRAGAGRSSIAKLESMKTAACTDGRVRGMSMYHGAGTGRWTGRLIQLQNLPRGEITPGVNIEDYIPYVMANDYDTLALMDSPIIVVMSMLRSMLIAGPGKELFVADFSAIEARVLNWLARQLDMVELFRKYDAAPVNEKQLFDPYRHNAAKLYHIPLDQVQKFPHRNTGKFQELAAGFGMGAKKAVDAGKAVYQIDMTPEFAKEIIDGYRSSHQHVVDYWEKCNSAAITAVLSPGASITVNGNVKFVKAGAYLYIILPSGRPLAYPAPRVVDRPTPWGELRPSVEFSGVNPVTQQWDRMGLYGGLITENIVQAVARDLLAEAKLRLEAAGYTPIISIHDEIVSEVPEGFGTVAQFEKLMSDTPDWAAGCPVAAEGFRSRRYRK